MNSCALWSRWWSQLGCRAQKMKVIAIWKCKGVPVFKWEEKRDRGLQDASHIEKLFRRAALLQTPVFNTLRSLVFWSISLLRRTHPPLESLLKNFSTVWGLESWKLFGGSLDTYLRLFFFLFFPKTIFTTSDWSRPVFDFESATDVVERRRIARNSSLDIKKFLAENGHFGILVVNFKRRQNHTIWGSFESS